MLPTNTTDIHEITHVLESFTDYVVGNPTTPPRNRTKTNATKP